MSIQSHPGSLRNQMILHMRERGLAQRTIDAYLLWLRCLQTHYRRCPSRLTHDEIEAYLLHLIRERKLAKSTVTQAMCALEKGKKGSAHRKQTY